MVTKFGITNLTNSSSPKLDLSVNNTWELYFQGHYTEHSNARRLEREEDFQRYLNSTSGDGLFILNSVWTQAIGHIASLEYMVKAFRLGLLPCRDIKVVTNRTSVANPCLLDLYKEVIDISLNDTVCEYEREMALFSGNESCFLPDVDLWPMKSGLCSQFQAASVVQSAWESKLYPPLLQSSREFLSTSLPIELRNILNRKKLAVIHARCGFDLHGLRSGRNVNIEKLYDVFTGLYDSGYVCVRIGDHTMPRMPYNIPCVDAAHIYPRSSSFDVELIRRASIFIASNSGPMHIRSAFGKSTLIANSPQMGLISAFHHYGTINLPKIWRDSCSRHPVQIREILKLPCSWSELSSWQNYYLDHVDQQIILDAALSMDAHQNKLTKEALQFKSILDMNSKFTTNVEDWAVPTKQYLDYYRCLA